MDTEHTTFALAYYSYYKNIVEHRRRFIFKTGVDYNTHHPDTINFIPPQDIIAAFESDYASMREQMIYDEQSKILQLLSKDYVHCCRFSGKRDMIIMGGTV